MTIFFPLRFLLIAFILSFAATRANAQQPLRINRDGTTQQNVRYDAQGRVIPNTPGQGKGQDSLKHRDNTDDSITIYYRYFDSTRTHSLDSSIGDFTIRYPLPADYVTLGNLGSAAHSLLFRPLLAPGFDPGFHAFDIYKLRLEETRFYQTTRPYTELGYLLGSKAEQMINVVHTQNIRPNFNMALQYRLINSPGNFQNQNTNDNSFRINGNYQSRNKRYSVYGVFISNKTQASENGGIRDDNLLNDSRYTDRYVIPTRLSGDSNPSRNPFSTTVVTGNIYKESRFLLRQQYDFGQSDSLIVNDSTVVRLFYPRFRLQHTFSWLKQQYEFHDYLLGGTKKSDYLTYFGTTLSNNDSILYRDGWKNFQNDFSIISFPEKNNLNQFIKAGIAYETWAGTFTSKMNLDTGFAIATHSYHNIFLNGEYRNRTRNQKWDIEGTGKFYLNGFNVGDYAAQISIKRLITKKIGYFEAGFQNINRSPSFVFNAESAFPPATAIRLNKENITRLSASLTNDTKKISLTGEYYLISNYTYFSDFYTPAQEGTLFNVLHVAGKKQIRLSKVLNLYSEIHLQKTAGSPPLNLPLFFTSNRIAFEGVYYRNMTYSIGAEVRYHTPYKADNYSPFVGQFLYQNNNTISNRPEINGFFNFRIKTFKAFIRAENLNTLKLTGGNVGFNKNNLSAPHYPQQGFWFRTGIWWTFIN